MLCDVRVLIDRIEGVGIMQSGCVCFAFLIKLVSKGRNDGVLSFCLRAEEGGGQLWAFEELVIVFKHLSDRGFAGIRSTGEMTRERVHTPGLLGE